jgi:hypothetical protein
MTIRAIHIKIMLLDGIISGVPSVKMDEVVP